MSNRGYLPSEMGNHGPAPWISTVRPTPARGYHRWGPVRSGSGRSYSGGHSGNREFAFPTMSHIAHVAGRMGFQYAEMKSLSRGIEDRLEEVAHDIEDLPHDRTPAPVPGRTAEGHLADEHGNQLALPRGRGKLASAEPPRVFPMGPGRVTDPLTDRFGEHLKNSTPGGSLRNQPSTGRMSQNFSPGDQPTESQLPGRENVRRRTGGGLGPQGRSRWLNQ